MSRTPTRRRFALLVLPPTLIALAAVPASGGGAQPAGPPALLSQVSSSVAQRYFAAHPDQAPGGAGLLGTRSGASAQLATAATPAPGGLVRFNKDATGLPQNEESVSVCYRNPSLVLGGTNDYRGLLNPQGNFTGWHLSTNGGRSVAKEGLLPPVPVLGKPVPSGGDPVDVIDGNCTMYAASLNYDPTTPFGKPNGIGLYKTTAAQLLACPGGDAPSCWPTRRSVGATDGAFFNDKEWLAVGRSGRAGRVVWATWSRFNNVPSAPLGYTQVSIYAVRCDADLRSCTSPIKISGADQDVQFSDVTVGPDGRTYITWADIKGELQQTAQTFTIKMRVAEPGSTTFGPTQVVATEPLVIPFGGRLHADAFRIATYPRSTVAMVNGRPRTFVTWEACRVRVLNVVCEEPQLKLRYSDDRGRTWSPVRMLTSWGDNYFPAIDADPWTGRLAVAYFTNRYDPVFHSRQDVVLATVDPMTGRVMKEQRITPFPNDTQADPILYGRFIGDYIDVKIQRGKAYVHFNANYVKMPLLGTGLPVPQQDNYLKVVRLSQ